MRRQLERDSGSRSRGLDGTERVGDGPSAVRSFGIARRGAHIEVLYRLPDCSHYSRGGRIERSLQARAFIRNDYDRLREVETGCRRDEVDIGAIRVCTECPDGTSKEVFAHLTA